MTKRKPKTPQELDRFLAIIRAWILELEAKRGVTPTAKEEK